MAKITPLQNGLHSLAKALEAFNTFYHDESDAFALKDAVLRGHHAMETISKAILFELNPVFLLKPDTKVNQFINRYGEFVAGKNTFIIDEEYTIGLITALERLQTTGQLQQFPEKEFSKLKEASRDLEDFRNAIQHFAIEVNSEVVARVLGNTLPRFTDMLTAVEMLSRRHLSNSYYIPNFDQSDIHLSNYQQHLKTIYPDSINVLELLRTRYDRLIQEAIQFFRNRDFPNIELSLKVEDHGAVGVPPYRPELTLSGCLSLNLDRLQLTFIDMENRGVPRMFDQGQTTVLNHLAAYDGTVTISQPTVEADTGLLNGNIRLDTTISLRRADTILQLPGAEEFMAILRDITININATLHYKAEGYYDHHYSVDRVLSATGICSFTLTAIPSGFNEPRSHHSILGTLTFDLNEGNAPFRLHTFVEPNGDLSKNHSLRWTINGQNNFHFT